MKRSIKLLITVAGAFVLLQCNALTVQAEQALKSSNPEYWGKTCIKIVLDGKQTVYTPKANNIDIVVVSSADDYKLYPIGPFKDLSAPKNPKTGQPAGITQAIVCQKDSALQAQQPQTQPAQQSAGTTDTERSKPAVLGSDTDKPASSAPQDQPAAPKTTPVPPRTSSTATNTPSPSKTMPKTGGLFDTLIPVAALGALVGYMFHLCRLHRKYS